jgi:hypothetical protein
MPVKIRYSPTEERLLAILRKHKTPIDSDALCDIFYADDPHKPWNAQGSINAAMRSLIKKCVYNSEPFVITKSDRRGPHPIEFQLVQK